MGLEKRMTRGVRFIHRTATWPDGRPAVMEILAVSRGRAFYREVRPDLIAMDGPVRSCAIAAMDERAVRTWL